MSTVHVRSALWRLLVAMAIVDVALGLVLMIAYLRPLWREAPHRAGPSLPDRRLGAKSSVNVRSDPPGRRFDDIEGTYYQGDHLGFNWGLALEPDGTYRFSSWGCLGEYERDGGTFHFEGDRVILSSSRPTTASWIRKVPTGLHPVRWGDRLYLIKPEEMADFRESIVRTWEPGQEDSGIYLLRRDDWKKAIRGLPDLPGQEKIAAAAVSDQVARPLPMFEPD